MDWYANGVQIHNQEQSMKQPRQTAVVPAAKKQLVLAEKVSKSAPVPLSEAALRQVAGGVSGVTIDTPHQKW